MGNNRPLTHEELNKDKSHKPVRNINIQHRKNLTRLEKLVVWITDKGSTGFFIIIFVWTIAWLGWNTLAPSASRFDPFPAFVLWLFLSNMLQIFLMPLIMIGQNLQGRHSEARAKLGTSQLKYLKTQFSFPDIGQT